MNFLEVVQTKEFLHPLDKRTFSKSCKRRSSYIPWTRELSRSRANEGVPTSLGQENFLEVVQTKEFLHPLDK
ncbi:hypothetical protein CH376_18940 [Leptospira adleri]|uniref:DUF1564 family protein n=1 Tax=Leptospira adleri TaxID=2023186 RepID=A0ABX4NUF5_9LEPT|nr:hypothetical protein CH376_18940 [Leptospira adleri]